MGRRTRPEGLRRRQARGGRGRDESRPWQQERGVAHARVLVQVNGTVLDAGESVGSERVVEAAGPGAALHLHLGDEGAAAGSAEVEGYRAQMAHVDERRRHIETHRGHLTEVTDLERPFVTAELIRRATDTGTADEVRAYLEQLERSGVTGALYFPAGPDIARELRAFAACALG
jgi:5,10-methylenetetrahydromethanopterin reductase